MSAHLHTAYSGHENRNCDIMVAGSESEIMASARIITDYSSHNYVVMMDLRYEIQNSLIAFIAIQTRNGVYRNYKLPGWGSFINYTFLKDKRIQLFSFHKHKPRLLTYVELTAYI